MQKFKVSGQSVPKIEWKQTDRWTEVNALPPTLMRSVKVNCSAFDLQKDTLYIQLMWDIRIVWNFEYV